MFNQAYQNGQSGIAAIEQGMAGDMAGGSNPYGGAENSINSYLKQGLNQLSPYDKMGQNAGGSLAGMLARFSNPEQFYNNFAKNYQMSAGAQSRLHSGLNAVQAAMAQHGLTGSGAEQKALSSYTQGIIGQDMNDQFNNILNTGRLGAGIGSTLYGGGLNAALKGADLYQGAGTNIAGLQEAMENQRAQQQAADKASDEEGDNQLWSTIGTGIGMAAMFL